MKLNKYIGSKIKNIRVEHGYTIEELANKLNVSRVSLTRYENGTRKANQDVLFELANFFKVSIDYFFPSNKYEKQPTNITYLPNINMHMIKVPIIGTIACGTPITAEQNIEGYTTELFTHKPPKNIFALRCKGESMEPIIPNGAMVTIEEQPIVEDGEIAAVLLDDDTEATLKKVKHISNNQILLIPENKKYTPILLDKNNPGRILGKVIHVGFDM